MNAAAQSWTPSRNYAGEKNHFQNVNMQHADSFTQRKLLTAPAVQQSVSFYVTLSG